MKVFCGKCKYYGHGKSGQQSCYAPDNYVDAFDYPKCRRLLHPEARNRKNDCILFTGRLTGYWNFLRFWE